MKNPIIIPVQNEVNNEHDLELNILANLNYFFRLFGNCFAFIGNQYKIIINNHNYFIDILLFNMKLMQLRSLKKEDKAQME